MITDIQLLLAVNDKNIRFLEWRNNGELRTFRIEDVVEGFEAAQQSVQADLPLACEFCGHLPAKPNDGLRNLANTAGG